MQAARRTSAHAYLQPLNDSSQSRAHPDFRRSSNILRRQRLLERRRRRRLLLLLLLLLLLAPHLPPTRHGSGRARARAIFLPTEALCQTTTTCIGPRHLRLRQRHRRERRVNFVGVTHVHLPVGYLSGRASSFSPDLSTLATRGAIRQAVRLCACYGLGKRDAYGRIGVHERSAVKNDGVQLRKRPPDIEKPSSAPRELLSIDPQEGHIGSQGGRRRVGKA